MRREGREGREEGGKEEGESVRDVAWCKRRGKTNSGKNGMVGWGSRKLR